MKSIKRRRSGYLAGAFVALMLLVAACKEPIEPSTHDVLRVVTILGTIRTETGEPFDSVFIRTRSQGAECQGEPEGGGGHVVPGGEGTVNYVSSHGEPGWVRNPRCLHVIVFPSRYDQRWRRDSVKVGLVNLRFVEQGLDTVWVHFVLRKKEDVPE